ncbi:maltooligosyltrehalose trehalohydrolase [Conyzicola nivalis]|uniref:Malto-oligosyltrehalose trehalohydrolase n=1 Tax=Conyzicola nivalis TaxID=1477021 RepID=A0ABV2QMY4_9MICO
MTAYRVWAPAATTVELNIDGEVVPLESSGGYWSTDREQRDGERYGYSIDGGAVLPDPRSRRQPDGVHGLSAVYDPGAFSWTDRSWKGRQLAGGTIYELHIGTFTPQGTLDSAIERLDHLVELGIDFVEVLPVNSFNGTHNWGYDGVLWYSVQETYGGPAAYQRFVDACHARGLGVIQDVVYNHLGPSGNYLPQYGPYLHTESANTWGSSVNLDEAEVRRYILDNAKLWLGEYHVDGLRLDAVHALVDTATPHVLKEMAEEVDALSAFVGRPLTLIAESDLNDASLVAPREANGTGLASQWSDDYHHALHVALTGETTGYYADFASLGALAKVATKGFFHDGTFSSFRGRDHGFPIDPVTPTWRLVTFSQDHDQIGNRAAGDRLTSTLDAGQLAIAAVFTLCSPYTPMLFQGEEWGASTPWQFFTSHPEPDLGRATAEGRIAEFAAMGWDPATVPDPQDPQTFERSKLDWSELAGEEHARLLTLYRELIALRRTLPALTDPDFARLRASFDDELRWFRLERDDVSIVANFGDSEVTLPVLEATVVLSTDATARLDGTTLVLPSHAAVILQH